MSRTLSGVNIGANKFGANLDVDTGAPEDIWTRGGLWVPPTAARIHAIVSDSTADDKLGVGGGAWTMAVQGILASGIMASEVIDLDGTTSVNTTLEYLRLHRMIVLTAGISTVNAGLITATAVVDGTVTAEIAIAEGQTQMAIYTIPYGFVGLLEKYKATMLPATPASSTALISILAQHATTPNAAMVTKTIDGLTNLVPVDNPYGKLLPEYPELTDLRMRVSNGSVNNLVITGSFDVILKKIR